MQEYPSIDHTLIEELNKLGYTESEMTEIIRVLELNASTAGIMRRDPKRILWINRALAAIIRRFNDTLKHGYYDALLNAGYTPSEIGNAIFTNLLPPSQLLDRIEAARTSGEYQRIQQLGYSETETRSLILTSFTISQLRAFANRVNSAQRRGSIKKHMNTPMKFVCNRMRRAKQCG